jgi:uncharacterized membrane protein YhaH (DUF805 family)
MGFGQAIQSGFRNYVNFTGRAARSEYWYWVLFAVLLALIARFIDYAVGFHAGAGIFSAIVGLAVILPDLAVGVRRLHDRDKSGWFLLLCLIPLIGSIILLVWFCQRGTAGVNRFGSDPLAAHGTAAI